MNGELANETLNYDTKTKAQIPNWTRSVTYQSVTPLENTCVGVCVLHIFHYIFSY